MPDYSPKKIITCSARETEEFGKKLAASLTAPVVLGLVGDLGAGKTQFVKGLALGLGIRAHIASPTFVLLKIYKIKNHQSSIHSLIHIDCYRLGNPSELLELGFAEFMHNKNSLIVIEWADKIKDILPKNTLWIKFSYGKKLEERIIIINSKSQIANSKF